MIVLAGDVGGTNARLALVDVDGHSGRIVRERKRLSSCVRARLRRSSSGQSAVSRSADAVPSAMISSTGTL